MRRYLLASAIGFMLAMGACAVALYAQPAQPAPFTELESARLDALAQEGRALEAEQRALTLMRERWQGKIAAFKSTAEAVRPGFTWDAQSGQWTAKPKETK